MKKYTLKKYTNMKRDLYRFAKARRHGERIYMWEAEWHKTHNEEYYKQNLSLIHISEPTRP